jgi:hypothetical protein
MTGIEWINMQNENALTKSSFNNNPARKPHEIETKIQKQKRETIYVRELQKQE